MANILGTLFVNVTANTADFIGGLDKASFAARKSGRDIESSFNRLGDVAARALAPLGEMGQQIATTLENVGDAAGKAMASMGAFAAVGVGAGVAAAGLGTALVAAATHAAELGSQIFEASEKTGLSAEKLSGLMALSKETGGNFDVLTVALGRATANLEKTAEGGGKANAALFQMMGGAQGAAELGLKPMDDRLQIVLKRIFDLNDVGQRNLALTQLLGKGWQQNVETLKLLAEQGYAPAIEAAKKFGIYFNADQARQAKEFQIAMTELQASVSALALTIGREAIPFFTQWAAIMAGMGPGLAAFGDRLKAVWSLATVNIAGFRAAMADADAETKKSVQAQTDFLTRVKELTAGARAAGTELEAQTGKLREHKDALDRGAEASRRFWADFNLGLAQAKTEFPKVIDLFKEITKLQGELDKKAETSAWQKMVTTLATGVTPGGAAVAAAGLPPGLGPAAPTAVMPSSIEELSAKMTNIMKAGPAVRISDARIQFMKFFDDVEARGAEFGPKVFDSLNRAIGSVSDQLARLVVTGKSSFRQLFEGLEMEILKTGIDRLFARIAKSVESTAMGGGGTAGAGAAGVAGATAGTGFGGFLKGIASLFGGFRAAGGPVIPGRAYMVGERGPELFVPRQPGSVATGASVPGHTTVLNFNVHGVSDYDSFRRSQSQIMAGLQHQLSTAYSRQQG